jgi:hypothetical protein
MLLEHLRPEGIVYTVTDPWDGAVVTSDPFDINVVSVGTPIAPKSRVGRAFSMPGPSKAGFPGPVTWTLESGKLPPGLVLDAATGAINGVPAAVAGVSLVLRATSGRVTALTDSFSIVVVQSLSMGPQPDLTFRSQTNTSIPFAEVKNTQTSLTWTGDKSIDPVMMSADYTSLRLYVGKTTYTNRTTLGVTFIATDTYDGTSVSSNPFNIYVVSAYPGRQLDKARVGFPFVGDRPSTAGFPGTVTWSIESGTLPNGLSFDPSTGIISGTPTVQVSSEITLRATSGTATVVTDPYTLTVSGTMVVPSPGPLVYRTGQARNLNVSTPTGYREYPTWSISPSISPGTVTADNQQARINIPAGMPRGTIADVRLTARDPFDGTTATSDPFTIYVVTLEAADGPFKGRVGVPLATGTPTALGFPGTVTWKVESGTLPKGMELNAATGVISGTPTAAAGVSLTLRATAGVVSEVTGSFNILVNQPMTMAAPADMTFRTGQFETKYTTQVANSLNTPTWSTNIPISPLTIASGSPTTAAGIRAANPSTPVTFTGVRTVATDPYDGTTATSEPFNIHVVTLPTPQTLKFRAGTNTSSPRPTALGFPNTPGWTLSSGAMPNGLTLDAATGVIYGSAAAKGQVDLRLTAASGTATAQTDAFAVAVGAPLTIGGTADVAFRTGSATTSTLATTSGKQGVLTCTASPSISPLTLSMRTDSCEVSVPPGATAQAFTGVRLTVTDSFDAITATSEPFNIYMATLTLPSVLSGKKGVAYNSQAPSVVGLPSGVPVKWSLASGDLPATLSLDQATGAISGTPTVNTSYTISLKAEAGTVSVTSPVFTITITN